MAGSIRGLPLSWWAPTALPILGPATSQNLISREVRLYGWSFIETSNASPATVQLLDGGNANGADVVDISLSAGQSTRDWLGAPGLRIQTGLFLNVISGTVRGSVWILGMADDEIFRLAGYQSDE